MFEECKFTSGDYDEWPYISSWTSSEELQYIHKKIWDYAVDNNNKPDTPYDYNCAACQYCKTRCSICPIIWPDEKRCLSNESIYAKWIFACEERDYETAKELAQQIRELPFRTSKKEDI